MTNEEISANVWSGMLCDDHAPAIKITLDDVEEVIEAHGNYEDWDTDGKFLGRLKDGRFIVAWEWSDSTGHGCQCGGGISFYDTLQAGYQGYAVHQ